MLKKNGIFPLRIQSFVSKIKSISWYEAVSSGLFPSPKDSQTQSCVAHYPHPLRYNLCVPDSLSLIARFMGPTWGPSEADRTQVGPMLALWTLLSGMFTAVAFMCLRKLFVHVGGPQMTSVVESHNTNSMVVNNGQQSGHLSIQTISGELGIVDIHVSCH